MQNLSNLMTSVVLLNAIVSLSAASAFIGYILYSVKVNNRMPIQIDWLNQSFLAFFVMQVFTLAMFSSDSIKVQSLAHWIGFLTIQLSALFLTRFNINRNEALQRLYIMFSHFVLSGIAVFSICDVYFLNYTPQNSDAYTFIYSIKDLTIYITYIINITYIVLSLMNDKVRTTIRTIETLILTDGTLILLSYCVPRLYPMCYILFTITTLISYGVLCKNVVMDKGRFLRDDF